MITIIVTMKKIAELCGVSRGTVDRVLNGRGRVNPKTEAIILNMAEQLGYEPNPAGKALAARKHKPVISVILPSEGNAFFDEVIRGMTDAANDYKIYGLDVKYYTMRGYDIEKQCELIEKIQSQSNGIVINPIDSTRISDMLNVLIDAGKFVVTVNNDISGGHRHCYVGTNYFNGGETACALLATILGSSAKIGIVLGSNKIMGHRQRLEGFQHRMAQLPDFKILKIIENEDDEIYSYDRTKKMLAEYPDITAIFIVAGGVYGASRAILDLPIKNRPVAIAFDSVPSTVEMMRNGIIKAIIYQHPYRQGHLSIDLAFEYLVHGREPIKTEYVLNNEIRLLENL